MGENTDDPGRQSCGTTVGRNSGAVLSGGRRLLGAGSLPSADFLPFFASGASDAVNAHRKLTGGSNHQGPGRRSLLSYFWGRSQDQSASSLPAFVTPPTWYPGQPLSKNKD